MKMIPWNNKSKSALSPWRDMEKSLNRFFDDDFFTGAVTSLWPSDGSGHVPAMDLVDKKDHYEATVDLPGVAKKDLDLQLRDQYLVVTGSREEEITKDEGGAYRERFSGRFERAIRLPEDVDAKSVKAEFKDGVLRVRLGKDKQADTKHRTIEIK